MLSNFLENALLNHVLKVAAYTVPTNLYVALGTAVADTGLTGEPVGLGYARIIHNTWAAPANRISSNTGAVTFPQASGSWGTLTHFAVYDALTAGNMLFGGALTVAKAVVSGNTPSFATGVLIPTFNAGAFSTYLANALLGHVLKVAPYAQPTTLNVALSTANPGDTGATIAEPVAANYARKAHPTWTTASTGASSNSGAITFNIPSGSWGLITHAAIFDALTVGNMLIYGAATPNQTPASGDTVEYATTTFAVTLD